LFAFLVLSTLVFVVALTSPARAECPEGMISYWKLDETSGAIYDDYYYVNDGVCAAACPTPTIGKDWRRTSVQWKHHGNRCAGRFLL
jgi:hypothetical protein